jgi:hypothetical protein
MSGVEIVVDVVAVARWSTVSWASRPGSFCVNSLNESRNFGRSRGSLMTDRRAEGQFVFAIVSVRCQRACACWDRQMAMAPVGQAGCVAWPVSTNRVSFNHPAVGGPRGQWVPLLFKCIGGRRRTCRSLAGARKRTKTLTTFLSR